MSEQLVAPNSDDEIIISLELSRRTRAFPELSPRQSLFDGSTHESVDDNLIHMAQQNAFFLPHPEQVRDISALLKYFGQKIGVAYNCIACNKAFDSVEDTRTHMIEKNNSCEKGSEQGDAFLDEFGEFYDVDEREEEDILQSLENWAKEANNDGKNSSKRLSSFNSMLQKPRTPSIRKYIKKDRGLADGKSSAAMQRVSSALRSPAARQAALMMVGGPAAAIAIKGAPVAIAVANKAMEKREESKQINSAMRIPMRVSKKVIEEYRKLGWTESGRLREQIRGATKGKRNELILMVDGEERCFSVMRFKHSMEMYNIGQSLMQQRIQNGNVMDMSEE